MRDLASLAFRGAVRAVVPLRLRNLVHRVLRRDGRAALPPGRLLFAFSGGSGAWPGMGCALYRDEPVFRASIDACSRIVEDRLGFSVAQVFRNADAKPPQSFAIARRNELIHLGLLQFALFDLWRAHGIEPDGLVSVSLGEVGAAYASGALTRDEAAAVLCAITKSAHANTRSGVIFLLRSDTPTAHQICRTAPAPLDYMGAATRRATMVLSSAADADAIRAWLAPLGKIQQEFKTEWTYHTTRDTYDPGAIDDALRGLPLHSPRLPFYSAVYGREVPENAVLDARYWHWMISHPFHFAEAAELAIADGFNVIVNIGAYPMATSWLLTAARTQGRSVRVLDSMRHDLPESATFAEGVRKLRSMKRLVLPRRRAITVSTFDLADPRLMQDPFSSYEDLRRDGSVHYLPRPNFWLILGYDEVETLFLQPELLSSDAMTSTDPVLIGARPATHAVVRRLLSRWFSNEILDRMRTATDEIVAELLTPLVDGEKIEIVRNFARPLSDRFAAVLLGIDQAGLEALREATRNECDSGSHFNRLDEPLERIADHIGFCRELREETSHLLNEEEIRSLVRLMWVASTMTTRRVLASSIFLLLTNDDVRRQLIDDPAQLSAFFDESIRLEPPELMIPRITTREVSCGGVTIPAGARVELAVGAANRDPRRFDDPSRLLLNRTGHRQLSFGAGIHRCIGAGLARIEVVTAIGQLLRRVPRFRAAQPLSVVRYHPSATEREIESLWIEDAGRS